jgi:hypothetical protein
MYHIGQIEDFANDVLKARAEMGQPVPASCLWCYGSRQLNGGLSLWRERRGELLIEAEGRGELLHPLLQVHDEAEARTAASLLAERGLYFNDNDPRR